MHILPSFCTASLTDKDLSSKAKLGKRVISAYTPHPSQGWVEVATLSALLEKLKRPSLKGELKAKMATGDHLLAKDSHREYN